MVHQARDSGSRTVADVMSKDVVTVRSRTTIAEVARLMREHDIGPVVVVDGESVFGVVTDRDIAVRAVADGQDPRSTPVSDVASSPVTALSSEATLDDAAEAMRAGAVRRVVITEGSRPIGILSLGDLALIDEAADDAGISLTEVSAAPPQG